VWIIKNIEVLLCIVIIGLCFYGDSVFASSNPNYMLTQQESHYRQSDYKSITSSCGDVFDIKFTPFKDNINNNSNIIFLPDGSFTVGNKVGVPKIYSDGITNGRYGITTSEIIETKQYFKSIIVKIDKIDSINGEAMVNFRAKDNLGNYTGWLGFDGHKGNKITFYPFKQYKYLECMVSIITNHTQNAPTIKSISVKLCN
jgi:hypothetical protein